MVFSMAVHTTLFVQVYTTDFTRGLTCVYRCRGLRYHPTLAIFILIILSFTGATIYWAAWVAFVTIQIRSAFVKNIGMEVSEKMALSDAATTMPLLIEMFLSPFMVL
jgi:hypothetical protein